MGKKYVFPIAYRRSKWIESVRSHLLGVFGEYCKETIRKLPGVKLKSGLDHSWDPEIKRLFSKLDTFLDPARVKLKGEYSREKMLVESYMDLSPSLQSKLNSSKREMLLTVEDVIILEKAYEEFASKTDTDDLFLEMLEAFRYSHQKQYGACR